MRQPGSACEGSGMDLENLPLELLEGGATKQGRRTRETQIHHVVGQPDHLEALRPPVPIQRGDPHLRHDLQHALLEGVPEALLRLTAVGCVFAEPTLVT